MWKLCFIVIAYLCNLSVGYSSISVMHVEPENAGEYGITLNAEPQYSDKWDELNPDKKGDLKGYKIRLAAKAILEIDGYDDWIWENPRLEIQKNDSSEEWEIFPDFSLDLANISKDGIAELDFFASIKHLEEYNYRITYDGILEGQQRKLWLPFDPLYFIESLTSQPVNKDSKNSLIEGGWVVGDSHFYGEAYYFMAGIVTYWFFACHRTPENIKRMDNTPMKGTYVLNGDIAKVKMDGEELTMHIIHFNGDDYISFSSLRQLRNDGEPLEGIIPFLFHYNTNFSSRRPFRDPNQI